MNITIKLLQSLKFNTTFPNPFDLCYANPFSPTEAVSSNKICLLFLVPRCVSVCLLSPDSFIFFLAPAS